jgi:WD40 repeat protein/beta-lactamase regulating signal transducer with metallopeptidase domain
MMDMNGGVTDMNAIIERLGWVLVHSVWQFALVALCAGLLSCALRRKSASLRYSVLVVALFATLAGPVITWLNQTEEPRTPRELLAKIPSTDLEPVPNHAPALMADDGQTPVPAWLTDAAPSSPTAAVAPSAHVDESPLTATPIERAQPAVGWSDQIVATLHPWMPWIVLGWCLGVAFCSLRPLFGWVMLSRLKRIGVSPVSADIEKAFRRLARQLGLHHAGAVLQSSLTRIPLVVGYFKPVILLPIGILINLPPSQLEAILAHELAHVRRHDFVVNLLQALLETLFFYHPAVWWLSHRVRVEREHCCDDLVLAVLDNRVEYGRALVAVEELRGRTTVLALGMHDGSLLARIRRIVGATPDRAATLWRDRWLMMGLAVASLLIAMSALWFGLESIAGQTSDTAKDEPRVRQPLKAELPDGRSVEFVGIAKNTQPAAEGWAPDGGPIGDVGYWPSTIALHGGNSSTGYRENGPHPKPDANAIDIFVRFRGLKLQPSIVFDTPTKGINYPLLPVKEPYDMRGSGWLWKQDEAGTPADRPKGLWRVGLTDEPWGRYVKISPTGEVLNPIQADDRHATTYQLIEVLGAKPNDRVPTSKKIVLREPNIRSGPPIPSPQYAFEIHAVDNGGLVHPANYWSSHRIGNTDLMESEYGLFEPLPDGRTLSHFEFRLRPYRHWVTFDNVSLEPGKNTNVKVSVETVEDPRADAASIEGSILSIDAIRETVVIRLGSDSGVKPRTILEVRPQALAKQRAQLPNVIGKLEVTRILSPDTAEARILEENPAGVVVQGDRAVVLGRAAKDDVANQRDPIRVNLKLSRQEFLLGESIPLDYEMQNEGDVAAPYSKGAFFPSLRINDGFRITAVKIDGNGKPVAEPVASWTKTPEAEGKWGGFQLQPGGEYSTTLFVTRYLRFTEPGRYRLRVENINRFEPDAKVPYSAGETFITLKQPTPAEARGVFEAMKRAPRAAYEDNAMRFLADAADFQAMHQPVYLPVLKEFAIAGDLDALESLERMENKAANEVVVSVLAAALDRDDWRTARACFQHLKSFLPFPNWYLDTSSELDKANRDRVARTWGPDFIPVLTRLAKRLNVEVTARMKERATQPQGADAEDPEFMDLFRRGMFPSEHPQSLLIDIDYIYRCVGRPEDLADCLAAFAQSIELTKSLPLETHQYFRPRGSAYGFHHTVVYMIQRGAQVPVPPKHPGEVAAFALALRNQPGFRPDSWEAVLAKWLRGDSPYLAEVILDHLPATVPAEVLAYLPTALADNYVDLQIAACNVAKAHPDPAFREPLQKILDKADDKYLRKYAVDAARANGLKAQYDDDAPFVDKSAANPEPPQKQKELPNEKGDDTKADNPQDQAALPAAEAPAAAQPALVLPDHLNVMAVGFDTKSNKLVTVATESDVRIRTWNLANKSLVSDVKLASELHGNRFLTGHLTLADDCRRVIAATEGQIGIWSAETGAVVRMLKLPEGVTGGAIRSLACTPDLKYVAAGVAAGRGFGQVDSQAVVWNAATGEVNRTVTLVGAVQTQSVALSPNGMLLAAGGQSKGTRVWDVKTGNLLLDLPNDFPDRKHPDEEVSLDGASQVLCLQFSPNGKSLAIGDMLGVKLVDLASGELLHDFEKPFRMGRSRLVFSNDGTLLARTATDKTVPIWSTRTGKLLTELPTESNDGAFSPDGKSFAAGFSDSKQALAVWRLGGDDAAVGAPIGTSGGVEVGMGQRQDRVVWTADSQQVFATGDFNSLTQWRHNSGRWQATPLKAEYHANSITASTLHGSPLVVIGTNVGTAEVWDSAAGKRVRELRSSPNYSVYAVAISPKDALVAACGTDGTIAVFDGANGVLRLGEKAEARMASLAFAPDAKTLAALDRYGVLVLWSITGGERLAEWKGVGGEDCTVQFARDGKQLGITGHGNVTLIPTEKGATPRILQAPEEVITRFPETQDSRNSGPFPGGVRYASMTAIAPDMRTAASIDPQGAVVIWNLGSRRIVQRLPVPPREALTHDSVGQGLRNLVFSPDGRRLAATSNRGHVVFWQVSEPAVAQKLATPALLLPDHWIVNSVAFDNRDTELVTVSTQSYATIRRWDVAGKKLISKIKLAGDKHGREFQEGTFRLSADRRRVIAATDAYVGIWDTATGKLLTKLPIPKVEDNDTVRLLTCTPDLSVIVGNLETNYDRMTLMYDAHTVVWDGNSGKMERILTHKNQTHLIAITLSPDGKRLATTNGGGATIWDTSSGQQIIHVPNDNAGWKHSVPETSSLSTSHVWSVQFSPNGQQLAIGDILGVKLVDAASGKLLRQLQGPYGYSSGIGRPNLVFSQDGKLLARLGTGDKVDGKSTGYVIPIWSTQTGQKLFELQTNANDAAFSADGRELAVGFSDLQQALAVWSLNADAANREKPDGPGPDHRVDKVEENGHYSGKTASEWVETFKPIWGDTKFGIQYGIAFTKPQRQYRAGERVPLVVFFRNAGKKPLKLDMRPDYFGNTPRVRTAQGVSVEFENIPLLGSIPHYVQTLEPGGAFGPFYLNFGLGESPRSVKEHWYPYIKNPVAGQCKLTHEVSIDVVGLKDGDKSQRLKFTTREIEFEIVESEKFGVQRNTDTPQAEVIEPTTLLLADLVRKFNQENKQLGQGLDQPALTESEVIEFIKRSDKERDAESLNYQEFAAFKAVAESKKSPKDSYLQVYTDQPRDVFFVDHLWQIRLMLPAIGHDGFVGLTIRDTKVSEEKIDPQQVAWGLADKSGLSLGAYLSPKKEKYQIGERVHLRLFVRNDGEQPVKTAWANTSHPMPDDFTVIDEKGMPVAVRQGRDGNWEVPWVSGYMSGHLDPGEVHRLFVPYEISIGGDGSNKLVGRVIEAKPGQTLELRVRESNGNERERAKGEPEPESGKITITIAEAPVAQGDVNPNGEIRGQLLDEAGKPVPDATIACGAVLSDSGEGGGSNAITDAQGRYRLLPPSSGIYIVWLKKYGNAEMTAAADDGLLVEPGKITESRMTLVKGTPVAGVLVDEQNEPVPRITVYCYSTARPQAGSTVMSVETDDEGRFKFLLPPGRAHLYANSREQVLGAEGKKLVARVHFNLTVPQRDDVPPKQAPLFLKLVPSEVKFGDPKWVVNSTPRTRIIAHANARDVTGTVVDERGLPLRGVKVFKEDGPFIVTGDDGEFRYPIDKGTQFVMYAFAPGHNVWFGTPTSGDVLTIGLEKKVPVQVARAVEQKSKPADEQNAVANDRNNALPATAAEFQKLMQDNTAKLAEGRLELALDYEWRRPTKDNPKRTVATQGTMRRIRKGNLLRIEFERQIANPSPDESNSWPDKWITGFDGEMEYSWLPLVKTIAYGELYPESRQLGIWEPPASAPQRNAGELRMQIKREQRDGHEVWDVRIEDKQAETVTDYIGVRPDHGYLPSRVEISSRNQPFSHTEFQDIVEPQPGVWVAKTMLVDAFYLDRPAKRLGYTAHRTKTTITRLELGDAAGLKQVDFQIKVPKDAQVRKWLGNEQRVPPAGVRSVHLQFLGGRKGVPVAGLQVEFTNGYGDLQKTMGTFTTDAQGKIDAMLPMAFYSIHLKSDTELPYLAVEKLWDGDSRGPYPDMSLYVRPTGVEKWLAGKRRDDGKTKEGGTRTDEQFAKWVATYTLLPACELVLRAVDSESGKGLAGAEFYEENAVGEEWAHPIHGQNIGSKLIREPEDETQTPAWRTDSEGNFKRLVGANGGYLYGVWKAPAGYEASEPRGEVEVKIVYGQRRAEHVFKFSRIKAAAEKPERTDPKKEKLDPKLGTLTGRFVYDGQRPVPQETNPWLAKLESNSPLPRDSAGRASGVAMTYLDYLKNMIRPSTLDQTLLVDEQGGVANVVVWVESKNILWQPPGENGRPPVTIRVQGGNFSPRVTLLTAGLPLAVANQDPVMFNFHADFRRNSGINVILKPQSLNQGKIWTLGEEEKQPERYRCDLAPWADGWILVRNNPYMAVTDEHGSFSIPNLPPGEWEFRAWHERRGFLTHWPKGLFKQKIVAGINDLGEVQVKPGVLGVRPDEIAAAEQAAHAEANLANPWERRVSLTEKGLTLSAALDKVATQARLKLNLDSAALAEVQLDVDKPISVSFENVPLEIALGRLIDWQAHLGVYRQLRGDKLVITTIDAEQKRTASRLPDWLKPHYGQGLLADVNDNGAVVSITASRIVTDEILEKFATLPELRELSIEVTEHLTPTGLAAFGRMPKLGKLSLYEVNSGDNGLGDDALRNLVGLKSLRELSIGECGTTNVGAKFLEQMPQLTSLSLRQEGGLTDAALKSIGKLTRLTSLSLPSYVATQSYGRMQFSADAIRELKELKDLETLHLVGHEVPADALDFPKLTALSLGSAQVDDEVARQIAQHRELRTLELSFCSIGDNGLKQLATLPELERLDFSSTVATDEGIAHFRTNKSLKHFSLRSSDLTDESLKHLAQIKTLMRLDLSSGSPPTFGPTKGFTIAGLQELKVLPRLDTLWLTGFELHGCGGLKELKHLRSLTFSMCSIAQTELDALEDALPDTNISNASGGGIWMPKRMRAKSGVGSPR